MDARRSERVFEFDRAGLRAPEARERFDDRLANILGVATQVFARDGYERASMRTIAREAGVSLAGLYHYVPAKERMLFLVQFRAFSALLTEVRTRLCGVDDPVEQLRTLIRTHVLYVAENMAALKVCSHELDALSGPAYEQVRRVRREYYELARDIIGRLIEERAPGAGLDRRAATMCLFGALNWLYRWYDPAGDRSPASLAHQIFAQFMGGVLGAGGLAGLGQKRAGRRAPSRSFARVGHAG